MAGAPVIDFSIGEGNSNKAVRVNLIGGIDNSNVCPLTIVTEISLMSVGIPHFLTWGRAFSREPRSKEAGSSTVSRRAFR